MLETIATIIGIVIGVSGICAAIARSILRAISHLNHRFDELKEIQDDDLHQQDLGRAAVESRFQAIEYQLETALEYGIHANRELIEHKMQRVERAIANIAGGLERVSNGAYQSRGPDYWPTDDPPEKSSHRPRMPWDEATRETYRRTMTDASIHDRQESP